MVLYESLTNFLQSGRLLIIFRTLRFNNLHKFGKCFIAWIAKTALLFMHLSKAMICKLCAF